MFKINLKSFVPIILGLITALIITSIGSFGVQAFAKPSLDDCKKLEIPKDNEVNTYYDKESMILTAFWFDESIGKDRQIVIDINQSGCSEKVEHLIDHVLEADIRLTKKTCEGIKNNIQNNITEVRGKKVNLEAGKQYVEKWCN